VTVLRDVLFDNGEPVGHREPRQASHKCIVKDCKNHASQGVFVGDLCLPCHRFITTGEGVYSQAYRNAKREWVGLTDDEIYFAIRPLYHCDDETVNHAISVSIDEYRAIESKLKEKNT